MLEFTFLIRLCVQVWYDNPLPNKAALGFDYFCVSRFALGLPGGEHGTSLVESKAQEAELLQFVSPVSANFINFGTKGFTVLGDIAQAMANIIPNSVATDDCIAKVAANPYWCGFVTTSHCLATPQCTFNSAKKICVHA